MVLVYVTSSFKESRRCSRLESSSNPPCPPFKGGFFSVGFQPLPSMDSGQAFGKACPERSRREGLGEIFGRFTREYVANF